MKTFTVSGSWPFPTDMLRYDCCSPASDGDALIMQRLSEENARTREDISETSTIRLVLNGDRAHPTHERWKSYGWRVVGDAAPGEFPAGPAKRRLAIVATVETDYLRRIMASVDRAAVASDPALHEAMSNMPVACYPTWFSELEAERRAS